MRWPATLLLALAVTGLAGCTYEDPGFSKENMVISIGHDGDGFALGVPLWLAPDGATSEDWLSVFHVNAGNATVDLRETQAGTALWIAGDTSATLEGRDLRSIQTGAAVQAYLDGAFSLGIGPGDAPLMVHERGNVTIAWSYEAVSPGCSLFVNTSWTDPDGLTPADARQFGYLSPPPHCTE